MRTGPFETVFECCIQLGAAGASATSGRFAPKKIVPYRTATLRFTLWTNSRFLLKLSVQATAVQARGRSASGYCSEWKQNATVVISQHFPVIWEVLFIEERMWNDDVRI